VAHAEAELTSQREQTHERVSRRAQQQQHQHTQRQREHAPIGKLHLLSLITALSVGICCYRSRTAVCKPRFQLEHTHTLSRSLAAALALQVVLFTKIVVRWKGELSAAVRLLRQLPS